MSEARAATLEAIRGLVADLPPVEKSMFGCVALMVDDEMLLAVNEDGSLLVRVDRHEDAVLRQESDGERAVMGPRRRDMGEGWLRADISQDETGERAAFWVAAARRRREPARSGA